MVPGVPPRAFTGCPFGARARDAGGVEAGSRGAKQPRVKEAQGGINPGKGCSLPNLRTAFGVRIPIQHAIPRVRASHDPGLSAETPPA